MLKDLSPQCKDAFEKASALSQEYGESRIGTAHLIYGLTGDHLSLGHRIFNDVNIYPEMFRDHLKKLPRETAEPDENGWDPRIIQAYERSKDIKKALGGGRQIMTDHLLIALLSVRSGSAYECMREFSVEPSEIINEIVEAMGFEIHECPAWDE
ncbi:MAG: hypothetical protein CSA62_05965 [Planctomycetota bacterium]|nr:MAG: hypothetical protein CSA62_05965 [Planctomycetota bacterium]